jgi:hypothetical protein
MAKTVHSSFPGALDQSVDHSWITHSRNRAVLGGHARTATRRHLGSVGPIACEDDAKLREYFAEDYAFYGPVGDLSFEELSAFRLKAPRSAGLAASSRRCRSTA